MRVRVLYFGALKDVFGCESETVELMEGARVADLVAVCRGRGSAGIWDSIAVAVNQEYARSGDVLKEGDEVALLPPVSGGCGCSTENRQRQGQPQVLRLRNSQGARVPSLRMTIFSLFEGGTDNGKSNDKSKGKSNDNSNDKSKSNDKSNGNGNCEGLLGEVLHSHPSQGARWMGHPIIVAIVEWQRTYES